MSKSDLDLLKSIARDARVLVQAASDLAGLCTQPVLCLSAEGDRPRRNGEQRSFHAYNPDRMCPACRAFWFAVMAAESYEYLYRSKKQDRRGNAATEYPMYEEAQPTMTDHKPGGDK